MVVIFELPQLGTSATCEFDRGFLFEALDELGQIARVFGACCEEVDVVGHDAICVDKEIAKRRPFSESHDQPRGDARILTEAAPMVETERDEKQPASAITIDRQAYVFAFKGGVRRHSASNDPMKS